MPSQNEVLELAEFLAQRRKKRDELEDRKQPQEPQSKPQGKPSGFVERALSGFNPSGQMVLQVPDAKPQPKRQPDPPPAAAGDGAGDDAAELARWLGSLKQRKQAARDVAKRVAAAGPIDVAEGVFAKEVLPEDRELVIEAVRQEAAKSQPMKKAGWAGRTATAFARGVVQASPTIGLYSPSLDPDQERFRQAMIAAREGEDPVHGESPLPIPVDRWTTQAAEMAYPMLQSVMAGRAAGGTLKALGAGQKAVGVGTAVATSGTFLPQIATDAYREMIGEGIDPKTAMIATLVVSPVEAAIESILPDPFKGASASASRGMARQVAKKIVTETIQRYGLEWSEEVLQAATRQVQVELAGKFGGVEIKGEGEGAPDRVLSRAFREGIDTAGPLAVLMAPGSVRSAGQAATESAGRPRRLEEAETVRGFQQAYREAAGERLQDPEAVSQWVQQNPERAGRLAAEADKPDPPSRTQWTREFGLPPGIAGPERKAFAQRVREVHGRLGQAGMAEDQAARARQDVDQAEAEEIEGDAMLGRGRQQLRQRQDRFQEGLGQQVEQQERELWSDPNRALQWSQVDREAAGALAQKPTYLPKDFEDADLSPPPDPAIRRQWKQWVREGLALPEDQRQALLQPQSAGDQVRLGPTWQRVPDGVTVPASPMLEQVETSFGTLVRLKPRGQGGSADVQQPGPQPDPQQLVPQPVQQQPGPQEPQPAPQGPAGKTPQQFGAPDRPGAAASVERPGTAGMVRPDQPGDVETGRPVSPTPIPPRGPTPAVQQPPAPAAPAQFGEKPAAKQPKGPKGDGGVDAAPAVTPADPLATLDAMTDDELADMFGAEPAEPAVAAGGMADAGEQDSSTPPAAPERREPFPTAKDAGSKPSSAKPSSAKPAQALPTAKDQRAAAQDQARQDFQNSMEELKRALRNMGETGFSGVPISRDFAIAAAHVARSTVRLAIIEGKAKAAQFADFVREVADAIGMEATRRYGQNLRDVWDGLRARMGDVMSESVDVESLSEESLVAKRPATLAPTRAADSEFNAKLLDAQPTMKAQADAAWRRYPAIRHLKSPEDLLQDAVAWMLDNKDKYDPARAAFKTWASRAVGWTAGKLNEKMIGRGEAYAESPVEPLSRDLTPAEEAIFAEDKQRVTFGGRRKISSKKTGGALVDPLDTLEAIADDELAAMFSAERTRSAVADTAVGDTAVVEQRTARQRDARRAVADSMEEVRQAASKTQLTLFEGLPISRELAVAISHLVRDTVRLAMVEGGVKVAQFSDFVKQVAEAIGADVTRQYGQNLRDGWDQLRGKLGGGAMSESVAVEGLLPPEKSAAVKEPWEMTPTEFASTATGVDAIAIAKAAHPGHVKRALADGKPVPDAVLDAYRNNGWAAKEIARRAKAERPTQTTTAAPEPTEPATPRQPVDILREAGLTVNTVTLGDGRTVWRVSGNTQPHEPLLRELGGSFYGRANAWTFWNEDPTRAIASRLDRGSDGLQLGDGQASAADVGRERYRRRESERPDGRGSSEEFREFVGADTQALIARGSRFGIPQHVTDGQVEDIGAVTRAFVNDKPVFVLGSAPGMGKTFVLGGVIRELRKRGAKRFVYVTENQELIRQVQANLADYGLDGVEFVTYAGVRREAPNTLDAVLLLDEAHNAKNLDTTTGNRVLGLVRDAKFTVYSTATPFENVSEAKYMEASGLFDGITAEVERRDSKGRRYAATIEGFDAWAWIYGAELFWPKGEDRPDVYWPKRHAATDAHIAANEWLAARGVYAMRPMVLPPGTVTSELRSVQADQAFVDLYGQVVDAYAAAEAGLGEGEGRLKGKIRAHGINLQKRILEAAKAQEGIRRAKELVADGKQVVMFVNTKADRDIGRYKLSEPYRKHHKIKGKAADQTYTPAEMREMMDRYDQAKAMARRMRDDVGPPPFAREVYIVAMAMEAAGIDTTLPSVVDDIMAAFPADQVVEYTGRLSDTQAKRQLDEWKQGKRQVIVATMDKGGTGLSYHDTTGAMPERVQLNINLPWSGTQVEQVAGRLARLGTAKPVALEWIFADNIEFERELSRTVGGRMRSMQAVVQGVKSETARKIRDFDIDESPAAPGVVALDDMGETGNNAVVTLADGTSREVQYIAVEDDVIIPSHDARRNFARNERGAKNIQRPYDNPVEGRSAREQVLGIAKADPKKLPLLVSDTPSAIDGPPVATIDSDKLIVRGGNARSQGVQLGYFNGGEEAERFKQAMVDAAEKFGIDPNKVAEMERPIIVRVIQSNANEDMTRLEQLLNDPMTAGMSAASVSASQAASLSQESVDQIAAMLEPKGEGDPPTVRELLANGKIASKIVGILVNDKAWGQREVDRFTAGDDVGELNDAGKLAIEELLIGRIVANPIVAGKMTPGVRRTLLASLGPLTRLTTHPKHGERFSEILRTAIEAFPGYKAAGSKTTLLDYFLGQTAFGGFEVPGQGDKSVAAVVDALDRMGMRRFKNVVEDILDSLGIKARQKDLFGSSVPKTGDVDAAIAATVDSPAVREKKVKHRFGAVAGPRRRAPRAVTRESLRRTFPGASISLARGGWHVEIGDSYFDVIWTPEIQIDQETRDFLDSELPPHLRDAIGAAGSFSIRLPDGTTHDGLGLIQLLTGAADEATLRHEALHLAKGIGLIGKYEWKALVKAHAAGETDVGIQEERIAIAAETEPEAMGVLARTLSWIRRFLADLGIMEYQARDIWQAMQESGFWRRPATRPSSPEAKYSRRRGWSRKSVQEEIARLDAEAAARMGTGSGADVAVGFASAKRVAKAAGQRGARTKYQLRGRPDLANIGKTRAARDLVDEVDEIRNQEGRPTERADDDVQREADERLARDYDGERSRILNAGRTGGQLSDTETLMAKTMFNRESGQALRSDDEAKVREAMAFIEAYRNTGADQARAFRQRFDPVESPAERYARAITEAILEPPEKLRKRRNKARREGDDETADAINDAWAKKLAELKAKLLALGVDIDNLHEPGYSKNKATEVLRVISALKASRWDKMYEYWRNAILSAPTTQAANLIGNTANAAWHFAGERLVEAGLNAGLRRPEGAQLGEFKHLVAGILPGLSRGARNFLEAWRTELPALERQLNRDPKSKIDGPDVAISGQAGRGIRIPQRILLAVDDFAKSLFVEMEVGARAYRIAKAEGLTGQDLQQRIADLSADIESPAWDQAYDSALKLAFQEPGSETVQKIKQHVIAFRSDVPSVRYLLPFVVTPVNIFAQGLKKTPLGTAGVAYKMWDNYESGKHVLHGLSADLAQQMVAWAVALALLGNDDDDPWITGTEGSMSREGRELSYRTRPFQSIKLGGEWFSYSRLEPFATAIGLVVDWTNAIKSGDAERIAKVPLESLAGQANDKTFLSGVGDLLEATRGEGVAEKVAKYASNFASSWVPNAVRVGGRESDALIENRRVWGSGQEWFERLGKRTLQGTEVLPIEGYPIYDVWGRPAERTDIPGPWATDWLYRITVPVRIKPDETFVADRLLMNWNLQNDDKARFPMVPSPRYTFKGESRYMSDGQYADFQRLAGEAARQTIEQFRLDPDNPTQAVVDLIGDVVTESRAAVKGLLIQEWESGGGGGTGIDTRDLASKIARQVTQRAQDTVRGVGAPSPGREAKTPYSERLRDFELRQDRAIEILQETGQYVPARKPTSPASFGSTRTKNRVQFRFQ